MEDDSLDVSAMRINYEQDGFLETQLANNPLAQFNIWLRETVDLGLEVMPEPNAMVLSTVNGVGEVHSRTVLLKGLDNRGFIFFTNFHSTKGTDLLENNRVSALFPWYPLHRQVIITGAVSRISVDESAEYFASRPYKSQLGAIASEQSAPISNREVLETRFAELQRRYPLGSEIPMPEHWGGFLITVDAVEFWQGQRSRLHDRLKFQALADSRDISDDNAWEIVRLSP